LENIFGKLSLFEWKTFSSTQTTATETERAQPGRSSKKYYLAYDEPAGKNKKTTTAAAWVSIRKGLFETHSVTVTS